MKWENHKDHVGYDWLKEDIYLTDIAKLQGNCKMSTMDSLESHESILKSSKRLRELRNVIARLEEKNLMKCKL